MRKAVVGTEAELRRAVAGGHQWIEVVDDLYLTEPVSLAGLPGPFFRLDGGWPYTGGGTIWRGFDGPRPLFSFPRAGKDWCVRIRGAFDGQKSKYPTPGPLLAMEWAQLSRFGPLWLANNAGDGLRIEASDACMFDDVMAVNNRGAGVFLGAASDFRWRGGTVERNGGGGLVIEGPAPGTPDSHPGPGLIDAIHVEENAVRVTGVAKLSLRGGYYFHSDVVVRDCPDFHYDEQGFHKSGRVLVGGVAYGEWRRFS